MDKSRKEIFKIRKEITCSTNFASNRKKPRVLPPIRYKRSNSMKNQKLKHKFMIRLRPVLLANQKSSKTCLGDFENDSFQQKQQKNATDIWSEGLIYYGNIFERQAKIRDFLEGLSVSKVIGVTTHDLKF